MTDLVAGLNVATLASLSHQLGYHNDLIYFMAEWPHVPCDEGDVDDMLESGAAWDYMARVAKMGLQARVMELSTGLGESEGDDTMRSVARYAGRRMLSEEGFEDIRVWRMFVIHALNAWAFLDSNDDAFDALFWRVILDGCAE